jgi:hypothetical protein
MIFIFDSIGICQRPGSLSSLPPTCENEIMMEAAEIDVLKAFLHPEVVMFEFGSGVASLAASKGHHQKKAPMIEASRAVSMWKSSWGDVQHPTPNPLVFSVFGSPNISQKLAIPLILQTGGFKSSIVITSCGCLSNSPIFIISNHNQP